jgi:hypothetical protein
MLVPTPCSRSEYALTNGTNSLHVCTRSLIDSSGLSLLLSPGNQQPHLLTLILLQQLFPRVRLLMEARITSQNWLSLLARLARTLVRLTHWTTSWDTQLATTSAIAKPNWSKVNGVFQKGLMEPVR